MSLNLGKKWGIDNTWTLFLDRDGVINHETFENYITSPSEYVFLAGTLEALKSLASVFKRIIVVTNQQGVGKGLMTVDDLDKVNEYMKKEIFDADGKIDAVYSATELSDSYSKMRKPNPGMGLLAQKDFPEIELTKSIMVGNSKSDIEFGHCLGMKTIFIGEVSNADFNFNSLLSFSNNI